MELIRFNARVKIEFARYLETSRLGEKLHIEATEFFRNVSENKIIICKTFHFPIAVNIVILNNVSGTQ